MLILAVRYWLLVTPVLFFCPVDILAGEPAKQASTGSWDRFRGPNGTGTSDVKDIPLTFGAKENLIWKVAISGAGNSSPVVWGKHLFLQSASNDGKLRSLLCLDTANGKIRWQKSNPAETAKIRADSSLASSTPTTDGKAVYVSYWDGKDKNVVSYLDQMTRLLKLDGVRFPNNKEMAFGRLFVGLLVYRHLAQGQVGGSGPGTHHVQGAKLSIARATLRLAVNGDMAQAQNLAHRRKPVEAAALERPAIQCGKHAFERVVGRNAMG